MIDVAEGRRLKAAADEALEMGEHVSVRDAQKAVDAWDRWLDGNMDALLDAAEDAERLRADRDQLVERCNNISADAEQELKEVYAAKDAAERELSETRDALRLANKALDRAIDAERGK